MIFLEPDSLNRVDTEAGRRYALARRRACSSLTKYGGARERGNVSQPVDGQMLPFGCMCVARARFAERSLTGNA